MSCIESYKTIKRLNSEKRQNKEVLLVRCNGNIYVLFLLKNRNKEANKIIKVLENTHLKKHIVPLKDYDFTDSNSIKILFEYSEKGNLYKYITSRTLENEKKNELIRQLALILYDFHKQGYLFGDIKPQNIIIFENELKISDVESIYKYSEEKKKIFRRVMGTPTYKYSYTGTKFYTLCDELFGFVATVYFILTGQKLISKETYSEIWQEQWKNFREKYNIQTKDLVDFYNRCEDIDLCVSLYHSVKNEINNLIGRKLELIDSLILKEAFNELKKEVRMCNVLSFFESIKLENEEDELSDNEEKPARESIPFEPAVPEREHTLFPAKKIIYIALLTFFLGVSYFSFKIFSSEEKTEKRYLIPIPCQKATFLDKKILVIEDLDGNIEFFKVDDGKIRQILDPDSKIKLLQLYNKLPGYNNNSYLLQCDSKGILLIKK